MLSLVFCTSYEARGKLIQSANEDFFSGILAAFVKHVPN